MAEESISSLADLKRMVQEELREPAMDEVVKVQGLIEDDDGNFSVDPKIREVAYESLTYHGGWKRDADGVYRLKDMEESIRNIKKSRNTPRR